MTKALQTAQEARVRVIAIDGTELSPAKPQRVRRMLESGVASFAFDDSGARVLQMKREVGRVVPHG